MPRRRIKPLLRYCSFCGKCEHEVRRMVAGPQVNICCECVEMCARVCAEVPAQPEQQVA